MRFLEQQVHDFNGHERLHMTNEEALLRFSSKYLKKSHWQTVERRLAEGDDQLFGTSRAARFTHLREAILAADAGDKD